MAGFLERLENYYYVQHATTQRLLIAPQCTVKNVYGKKVCLSRDGGVPYAVGVAK